MAIHVIGRAANALILGLVDGRFFAVLFIALAILSQSTRGSDREITNVAAFARLYGVARYFYPSDTAAALDWNRFAVYGVQQSRTATDATSLAGKLRRLFAPLGPGIQIGATLPATNVLSTSPSGLVAWRYLGAGINRRYDRPYGAERTNRSALVNATFNGYAMLIQNVSAQPVRSKTIRLRGQVRANVQDASSSAALWLRVDRSNRETGFADYMADRPVRDSTWREYSIEGSVADDATNIAFGVMAFGSVMADFDRIEIAVRNGDGTWTPVPIMDAGFEADATSMAWPQAGSATNVVITRRGPAPEGRQFLRLSPAGVSSESELFDDTFPRVGAHVDVDLGQGLKARVSTALADEDARAEASDRQGLLVSLAVIADPDDQPDIDFRLADTVVAWNVYRHFYPYWTDVDVDWDTRLRPLLETAYSVKGRDEEARALRLLVAETRDGHGRVNDTLRRGRQSSLPVQLALIEGRPVISATSVPSEAPIGAVVTTIDGVPASQRIAAEMRLASGSRQWKEVRALEEIGIGPTGSTVTMKLEDGNGSRLVHLRRESAEPPPERRPQPVAELAPHIWYVDLTRVRWNELTPQLDTLANAAAVIFDVRGYPTDAGARILPHLINAPEDDRWMHVPQIIGPFGEIANWLSLGWTLKPANPHFSGSRAFMTDGRAISYAESVMGYVADRKLGTIVGSPTAGTNGNIARFGVPGGFTVFFTGMRVTEHDGRTSRHLKGIQPNTPVTPTIAGIRSGRDEVLERAVTLVRGLAP